MNDGKFAAFEKLGQQSGTGVCRYCGEPRPAGYAVTCGRSDCQEAAFHDNERRARRSVRRAEKQVQS